MKEADIDVTKAKWGWRQAATPEIFVPEEWPESVITEKDRNHLIALLTVRIEEAERELVKRLWA